MAAATRRRRTRTIRSWSALRVRVRLGWSEAVGAVLRMGADAEVLEPEWLRQSILARPRRSSPATAAGPPPPCPGEPADEDSAASATVLVDQLRPWRSSSRGAWAERIRWASRRSCRSRSGQMMVFMQFFERGIPPFLPYPSCPSSIPEHTGESARTCHKQPGMQPGGESQGRLQRGIRGPESGDPRHRQRDGIGAPHGGGSGSVTFDSGPSWIRSQVTDVRRPLVGGGAAAASRSAAAGSGSSSRSVYVLLGGNPGDLAACRRRCLERARTARRRAAVQDRRRRERARGLPDRRLRQQHPGVLDRTSSTAGPAYQPAQTGPVLGRRRRPAAAPRRRPRSGRSTARADRTVYLDLGLLRRAAGRRFGAKGGPFAEALRRRPRVRPPRPGPRSAPSPATAAATPAPTARSVRTELQADCYAGVWANHAAATGFLKPLTERPDRARRSTRPPPWATTGSSRRRRARSTPRAGPTARPSSASTGSPSATSRAIPSACDTFSGPV